MIQVNKIPSVTHVDVIAEVGSVHDGSFGNALKLVEAAAACEVDAVKFQTHIAAAETLRDAPMPPYFQGEPRYQYFERTGFCLTQWKELKACCEQHRVDFLSSPFSVAAAELLEEVGVNRYKVGSGEVTNLLLLDAIARTGKPILLSSGMSTWAELDEAIETITKHSDKIAILQCTSEYPCAYESVGLNIMFEMRERYRFPVGLSDHTLTNYASLAAVTLGAEVIERHFTFNRLMYGSDARHSLETAEMKDLVQGIRAIEKMKCSKVDKNAAANNLRTMKGIFEKSIVSEAEIPAGSTMTHEMLALKKPGTGIPARRLSDVIGRTAVRTIPCDTLIRWEDLDA